MATTTASFSTSQPTTPSKPSSSSSTTTAAAANAPPPPVIAVGPPNLSEWRKTTPWMNDPKWFHKVIVAPSALLKMMQHCQSGVDKGIQKGGNPIEVMGMLLGRPHYDHTLVVTDAFPLPIEGFETRVIADDEGVINHMIQLGESLEQTRHEKFMGWYHSHPFDVGPHSHCFLSQTDLSTQLQWQRAEDPHGNPFVAIVIDPLRSNQQQVPELKAFRAYPPEYTSPILNECPNGSMESSEQLRLELWGSCWSRYYELTIEYGVTPSCRHVLEQLTSHYRWIRNWQSKPELNPSTFTSLSQSLRMATVSSASSTAANPSTIRGSTTTATMAGSGGAGATTASPGTRYGGTGSPRAMMGGSTIAATGTPTTTTPASSASGTTSSLRPEHGLAALTVGAAIGAFPSSATTSRTTTTSSEWSKAIQPLVHVAEEQECDVHLHSVKEKAFG